MYIQIFKSHNADDQNLRFWQFYLLGSFVINPCALYALVYWF